MQWVHGANQWLPIHHDKKVTSLQGNSHNAEAQIEQSEHWIKTIDVLQDVQI